MQKNRVMLVHYFLFCSLLIFALSIYQPNETKFLSYKKMLPKKHLAFDLYNHQAVDYLNMLDQQYDE